MKEAQFTTLRRVEFSSQLVHSHLERLGCSQNDRALIQKHWPSITADPGWVRITKFSRRGDDINGSWDFQVETGSFKSGDFDDQKIWAQEPTLQPLPYRKTWAIKRVKDYQNDYDKNILWTNEDFIISSSIGAIGWIKDEQLFFDDGTSERFQSIGERFFKSYLTKSNRPWNSGKLSLQGLSQIDLVFFVNSVRGCVAFEKIKDYRISLSSLEKIPSVSEWLIR